MQRLLGGKTAIDGRRIFTGDDAVGVKRLHAGLLSQGFQGPRQRLGRDVDAEGWLVGQGLACGQDQRRRE
ncbi:hypothetical protein A1507_20505 [Methylomonas koyamae]|uniref:Uncharacterized protein n=1 Tax=Methylomonas koyamae TaxID=702114 RepID=A0A177N0S8_9GAMM|nr:hypothetical protein A1507_20505 [Methylomonas koyamae]